MLLGVGDGGYILRHWATLPWLYDRLYGCPDATNNIRCSTMEHSDTVCSPQSPGAAATRAYDSTPHDPTCRSIHHSANMAQRMPQPRRVVGKRPKAHGAALLYLAFGISHASTSHLASDPASVDSPLQDTYPSSRQSHIQASRKRLLHGLCSGPKSYPAPSPSDDPTGKPQSGGVCIKLTNFAQLRQHTLPVSSRAFPKSTISIS